MTDGTVVDWSGYVGLPFGTGAGEVTCWSLVRRVYGDILRVNLPAYGEVSAHDLLRVAREMKAGDCGGLWRDVTGEAPRILDVVLMRAARGSGPVCHVGLLAGQHRLIHAEEMTGCVLVPLDHYTVKGRIMGLRRWVG